MNQLTATQQTLIKLLLKNIQDQKDKTHLAEEHIIFRGPGLSTWYPKCPKIKEGEMLCMEFDL